MTAFFMVRNGQKKLYGLWRNCGDYKTQTVLTLGQDCVFRNYYYIPHIVL